MKKLTKIVVELLESNNDIRKKDRDVTTSIC